MNRLKLILIVSTALLCQFINASEQDLYEFLWLDPDKHVFVLQNKQHKKAKKFFAQASYLNAVNVDFQESNGLGASIGYHFNEQLGIAIDAHFFNNSNNKAYQNILNVTNSEPFIRRPEQNISLNLLWTPFYGKINTFNKIFYFDVGLGVGLSRLGMSSNLNNVRDTNIINQFDRENYLGVNSKIFIKFHIDNRQFIGAEFNNTSYKGLGPRGNKTVDHLRYLNFSYGVSF
jgi:outer membrane beta-barrel protein